MAAGMTLWNRCVRDLQAELPEQDFNTWIRPLQAVEDGDVLRLLAPNRFVVDWLNQHYLNRIEELVDVIYDEAYRHYEEREGELGEEILRQVERQVMLRIID